MKKKYKIAIIATLILIAVVAVAISLFLSLKPINDSSNDLSIEGKYTLTSISGTINGNKVDVSMYEYYELILTKKGNVTIRSKASNSDASYEGQGTYTFKNNEITLSHVKDGENITETYKYDNGTITCVSEDGSDKLTIVLTKVNE